MTKLDITQKVSHNTKLVMKYQSIITQLLSNYFIQSTAVTLHRSAFNNLRNEAVCELLFHVFVCFDCCAIFPNYWANIDVFTKE
jgi:hypothetical protein